MIKVKITKNIMKKSSVAFGLTPKQMLIGALGCIIGILEYAILKNVLSANILLTIVFATIAIVVFFGIVNINGLSLIQFIITGGVDKHPFRRLGVFNKKEGEEI